MTKKEKETADFLQARINDAPEGAQESAVAALKEYLEAVEMRRRLTYQRKTPWWHFWTWF